MYKHLADVEHDLRTPLASLQLTIERRSSRDLVRSAIDDVVYMEALLGNLYLACCLQDGVDPLYGDPRVDLGMLVEHVTLGFAKVGRARAIDVHGARPDAPVWTRCNAAMAEQVLAHLVHNAIVHGDWRLRGKRRRMPMHTDALRRAW
jgi:signal transduction histidine kinase